MSDDKSMTNVNGMEKNTMNEPDFELTELEELELGIERLSHLRFNAFQIEPFRAELKACVERLINVLLEHQLRIIKLEAQQQ